MMESTTGGALVKSYFLLPVEQVTILDTWYGIGLKGSASHDVQVNDLFVPEHMIITVKDLLGGDFAGRVTNPSALFRPPVYMTFGILLTSAVVGMAEAMLAEYLAQSRKAVAIMYGQGNRNFSGAADQARRSHLGSQRSAGARARRRPRNSSARRRRPAAGQRYAVEISQQRRIREPACLSGRSADFRFSGGPRGLFQ